MEKEKKENTPEFNVADYKNIPCRKCKYGFPFCLDCSCIKYEIKPKDVYYENAPCPKFEPGIVENEDKNEDEDDE